MDLKNITVTILTKNSQKFLKEVLEAVSSFGEVLVYDTGSQDDTLRIARRFSNVRVVLAEFVGFGPTHNLASAAAEHNWILSIDSDEVVTPELIQALTDQEADVDAVYSFPRHNYFNEKWIKWCGWYPDRQIRLYNRTKTRFSDDHVHEAVVSEGLRHISSSAPLIHYSYTCISDFLHKMQSYSTLFAEQNRGKKNSSMTKAISHAMFAFFKSYVLKRGVLGGREGFIISLYNAHTAYYKYIKLYEANRELSRFKPNLLP